ncbi:Chitobiosyldiphosphodolichol beta-mannosyltransferase [Hondaea fermentalgiana]|uniref:Beta-1,4-mannosyltransferase n=1 Tax=Hondaea fermentalgiana TaxID=2315210 RepID=A0A2R5GG97_9STRA|nr:Chitobiosyldiphosphodolichol beta-mannosyltransferase [Hondaea fermentalgiana]|eukprot:GBG29932.1 Chitobiosyldiphosphodolichol beta-mannosyltransferase [Hondaea fermentalgiana]
MSAAAGAGEKERGRLHVAVLVLGDVGRSPRMQFHAASLAAQDWVESVALVGTEGSACMETVRNNAKTREVRIAEPVTSRLPRKLLLLYAPVKILQQIAQLLGALLRDPKLDVVLVQNPPCIPTFVVLALLRFLRGTRIVIDWHNLGFTILALSFPQRGERHPAVRVAKIYEQTLGWLIGDTHFCVTAALKRWLVAEVGTPDAKVHVLYDKPPAMFHPLKVTEQHEFWERLGDTVSRGRGNIFTATSGESEPPHVVKDRPALIVSSTSWTPDEDFGILLAALAKLDANPDVAKRGIICVVTGKGPQRDMYMDKVRELGLKHVAVETLWLEHEDYPLLLACMDVGVCLHTSSSGLDLPMKVVDMFGAGIPVCAVDFPCLDELVRHEENGLVFRTEAQLADQLHSLLFASDSDRRLRALRRGVQATVAERWDRHWNKFAGPPIKALGHRRGAPVFWFICFAIFLEAVYVWNVRKM